MAVYQRDDLGKVVTAIKQGKPCSVYLVVGDSYLCLQVAEQVRERTKALKIRDRRTQTLVLTITISGGMALAQPEDDALSLTARADAALYQSKQDGRNRITCA